MDWQDAVCLPPTIREWIYAGSEFEEQEPSDAVQPDIGPCYGRFYSIGLVQFHIDPDRDRIGFTYQIGPRYGCGMGLRVEKQGRRIELVHDGESGSWVS